MVRCRFCPFPWRPDLDGLQRDPVGDLPDRARRRGDGGARIVTADSGAVLPDSGRCCPTAGACADSGAPAGWRLVWSDEFDGAAGTAVDPSKWKFDLATTTAGATPSSRLHQPHPERALDGAGDLVITARKEALGGQSYTSARLLTQGKATWTYGRFEARIRIRPDRGCGRRSGCSATTSARRLAGCGESTSWRTSGASRRWCTARCTGRATPRQRHRRTSQPARRGRLRRRVSRLHRSNGRKQHPLVGHGVQYSRPRGQHPRRDDLVYDIPSSSS